MTENRCVRIVNLNRKISLSFYKYIHPEVIAKWTHTANYHHNYVLNSNKVYNLTIQASATLSAVSFEPASLSMRRSTISLPRGELKFVLGN